MSIASVPQSSHVRVTKLRRRFRCTSCGTKARWQALHFRSETSTIPRRRGSLTLTLCLGACSLDDRHLQPASGDEGMAGACAVGESDAGSSAPEGAAGEAASTGLVDGCADLDTDGIADCKATLVQNPSFTSDASGWTPLGDAKLTWDPRNALDDLPSGSAKLNASARRASAFQCVGLSGAQLVVAYASAFVEPAGDADGPAQTGLEVSFFDSDDCGGTRGGYFETPPSAVTGAWTTIQAGGLSTATTKSASVALVGIKAAFASELNVYFDNVMLKAKAP